MKRQVKEPVQTFKEPGVRRLAPATHGVYIPLCVLRVQIPTGSQQLGVASSVLQRTRPNTWVSREDAPKNPLCALRHSYLGVR